MEDKDRKWLNIFTWLAVIGIGYFMFYFGMNDPTMNLKKLWVVKAIAGIGLGFIILIWNIYE